MQPFDILVRIENQNSHFDKSINYILGNAEAFWWNERTKVDMRDLSGFFPVTDRSLDAFGSRMLKDIEKH